MSTRNKVIVFLAVAGIALFGIIQGYIIPKNLEQEEQYRLEQQSPITHDLDSVMKYKHKYMGAAGNLINLFSQLPLGQLGKSFQLYPEQLTAEISYKEMVSVIGESEVHKALLYNSLAAFALIDNLQAIHYRFDDASYKVTRSDIQQVFGANLSELLNKETWKTNVQDRLKDDDFTEKSSKRVLKKE